MLNHLQEAGCNDGGRRGVGVEGVGGQGKVAGASYGPGAQSDTPPVVRPRHATSPVELGKWLTVLPRE